MFDDQDYILVIMPMDSRQKPAGMTKPELSYPRLFVGYPVLFYGFRIALRLSGMTWWLWIPVWSQG